MHLWRTSSSIIIAANLASSSSSRISFIAMISPVVPLPWLLLIGDESSLPADTGVAGEDEEFEDSDKLDICRLPARP